MIIRRQRWFWGTGGESYPVDAAKSRTSFSSGTAHNTKCRNTFQARITNAQLHKKFGIAERPRDTSCHWILHLYLLFYFSHIYLLLYVLSTVIMTNTLYRFAKSLKVTQGYSKWLPWVGHVYVPISIPSQLYISISYRFGDIQHQLMAWPWNLGYGAFKVIGNGAIQ